MVVVPVMLAAGYGLQLGAFNFTVSADPLPSILVTFGLGVVIQNALLQTYSADSRGLDVGSIEVESIALTDAIAVGWIPLITLAVAIAILLGLQLMLSRTALGRAFRASVRPTGRPSCCTPSRRWSSGASVRCGAR